MTLFYIHYLTFLDSLHQENDLAIELSDRRMIRSMIWYRKSRGSNGNSSLVASGVEMRELRTFIFSRARVACPWQEFFIEGHTGWRRKGGRSSDEVAEQGDGDEVHLAERTADGVRGSDSTTARSKVRKKEPSEGGMEWDGDERRAEWLQNRQKLHAALSRSVRPRSVESFVRRVPDVP